MRTDRYLNFKYKHTVFFELINSFIKLTLI